MYQCEICFKEYTKKCGLKYHINHTHGNKKVWNKGLTKDSNKTLKKISEILKYKSKGIAGTKEKEELRKKKISETAKKNGKSGGYRIGSGRCIGNWYESKIAGKVYCQSSYELAYAKWLDKNNINWKKNWIKFPYYWENKIHYYIPDFYLINDDKYIETKGYETEKDLAKWKFFPYKLEVLKYQELKNLNIL